MEQLKIGGTLVIPIGNKNSQILLRVRRNKRGFSEEELRECSFVALIGEHGWKKPVGKD
jgi:protein-L-isoaspartate(D-aspartate) O-methyltransferase